MGAHIVYEILWAPLMVFIIKDSHFYFYIKYIVQSKLQN